MRLIYCCRFSATAALTRMFQGPSSIALKRCCANLLSICMASKGLEHQIENLLLKDNEFRSQAFQLISVFSSASPSCASV